MLHLFFTPSNYLTIPTANQNTRDHDTDWREGPWYRDRKIDWYETSSLKVKIGRIKEREQDKRAERVKWKALSCRSMLCWRGWGDVFDEQLDVSGVRMSDALLTHSELFRVSQDLYLWQSSLSFFPLHPGSQWKLRVWWTTDKDKLLQRASHRLYYMFLFFFYM